MIADRDFKALTHRCRSYKMHTNGGDLEKGYRPDYVLRKLDDFVILESENSSSRKTYVGAMAKAAHYLRNEKPGVWFLSLCRTSIQRRYPSHAISENILIG